MSDKKESLHKAKQNAFKKGAIEGFKQGLSVMETVREQKIYEKGYDAGYHAGLKKRQTKLAPTNSIEKEA